jgi:hypothetical protein
MCHQGVNISNQGAGIMDGSGGKWNWQAVGVILALLASIVNGAIFFGESRGQIERNTEDIRDMKSENRKMSDKLSDIQGDVKAIRSTLSVLFPDGSMKDRERD